MASGTHAAALHRGLLLPVGCEELGGASLKQAVAPPAVICVWSDSRFDETADRGQHRPCYPALLMIPDGLVRDRVIIRSFVYFAISLATWDLKGVGRRQAALPEPGMGPSSPEQDRPYSGDGSRSPP